ncbi:hypothetical protein [Mycolicibacterium fortuitum]|uniref:hypothetical protein n=1 Tax=Mycolicibacterium fortuitum TaxID=1766 RepID=UPI0014905242|nr:hypothetical protein [Mycolicibacterium fortuitum]
MSNDDLRARLAADIQKMFAPPEPVEPEPEPEPPSKGNVIPSAGQAPGYESYPAINELVNPTDKYAQLLKLIDQNNNR